MMETEILSDDQIEQLLQEAEQRLRANAGQVTLSKAAEQKRKPLPKLQHGMTQDSYIQESHGVATTNPDLIASKDQRKLADRLRPVKLGEKAKKTNDVLTAGSEWFDLPKTTLTPQLKRDLQLIELRSVLDPHRHYKKNNRRGNIPTFSQTGTIIEGPTEWYSSRINKKDRANNFVEETMATEMQTGRFKRKYAEIQEGKTSGKKTHYKKLMERRKKKS